MKSKSIYEKESVTGNYLGTKYNDGSIIGIDLGTTYSCASIMRNGNAEIIPDNKLLKKTIPSMVCFKDNECLIGWPAKNNRIQYKESTMFGSKKLLGYKFKDKHVQKEIKNWHIKVIEDKKTGKPQYVIKIGKEERKFFPEDVSSMILAYIKTYAEIYNSNKEIKKAFITVPANFNSLQREATIKAAENAGLEVINLIKEPIAAAIAYGNIWKSDKQRKVLIFDLGERNFDVSIVNVVYNEFDVLASIGEEHFGGEDFTQILINYVMGEIEKDSRFKNMNFENRNEKKIMHALKRINEKAEIVKLELSSQEKSSFFLDSLNGNDDLNLEITRSKFEELCMDLWEKCLIKIDEALKLTKLKKEDIDEIIFAGGATRTPKIKDMIEKYFNKKPLQDINPDEIFAHGAILATNSDLKIHDIILKAIGISFGEGKMDIIIRAGTEIPFDNEKVLSYAKIYSLKTNNIKFQVIYIYEGNNENISDNKLLWIFSIPLGKNDEEKIIKISMSIDHNFILKVIGFVNNEKNVETKIDLLHNEKETQYE